MCGGVSAELNCCVGRALSLAQPTDNQTVPVQCANSASTLPVDSCSSNYPGSSLPACEWTTDEAEPPQPSFHTPCFKRVLSRRRTEVVVGTVESVDFDRIRRSERLVAWGWPWGDSRMNRRWLWRGGVVPIPSSSCPRVVPPDSPSCSHVGPAWWQRWGFLEDSTGTPRGIHRPDSVTSQVTASAQVLVERLVDDVDNCLCMNAAHPRPTPCAPTGAQRCGFLEESTGIPRGIHRAKKNTAPGQGGVRGWG